MKLSTTQTARVYTVAGVRAIPAAIDRDGIGNARTLDAVVRSGLVEHAPSKVPAGAWSHGGYVLTDAGRTWIREQRDAAHGPALVAYVAHTAARSGFGSAEHMNALRMAARAGVAEWPIAMTWIDRAEAFATPALNEVAVAVIGATMIHEAAAAMGFDLTGAIAQADAELAARWDVARAVELAAGRDGSAVQAHPATGNPIVWVDGDRPAELVELIAGRDRVAAVVYMASRSHGVPLRSRFQPTPVPAVVDVVLPDEPAPAALRELDHDLAIRENRVHDAAVAGHDMNLRMEGEVRRAAQMREFAQAHLGCCSVPSTISAGARRTDWLRAVEHAADQAYDVDRPALTPELVGLVLVERCTRMGHQHVPASHPRPDLEAVAAGETCYRRGFVGMRVTLDDDGEQVPAIVDGLMYRGDGMVVRADDDPDRPVRAPFARLAFLSDGRTATTPDIRAAELDAYAVRPLAGAEGFYALTSDGEPFRVRVVSAADGLGPGISIRSYVLGSPAGGQTIGTYEQLDTARTALAMFREVCEGNGARIISGGEAFAIVDARGRADLAAGDTAYSAALVANARWTPAAA